MTGFSSSNKGLALEDLESTAELPMLDVADFETPTAWARARAAADVPARPDKSQSHEVQQQLAAAQRERAISDDRAEDLARLLVQERKATQLLHDEIATLREEAAKAAQLEQLRSELAQANGQVQQLLAQLEQSEIKVQELVASAAQYSALLVERDAELAALRNGEPTPEHAAALAHATGQVSTLEASLQRETQRREEMEAEAEKLRRQLQEATVAGGGEAAEATLQELRSQLAAQEEAFRELQTTASASAAWERSLQTELRISEQSLRERTAELEALTAQLTQAQQTEGQLRTCLREAQAGERAARSLLAERDALIHDIREELQSLKDEAQRLQVAAVSGSEPVTEVQRAPHEPVALEVTRYLIRTDTDTEIPHLLGARTTIGRSADNDLQVNATSISRHHALIVSGPGQTLIEDLHSTNGVRVNGRRITRHPLRDGDAVAIGRAQFRYVQRTGAETQ